MREEANSVDPKSTSEVPYLGAIKCRNQKYCKDQPSLQKSNLHLDPHLPRSHNPFLSSVSTEHQSCDIVFFFFLSFFFGHIAWLAGFQFTDQG